MSLPNRIAGFVTRHARIVLVALLLTTALVGAGMGLVEDDSSLDQFESDSPEAQALEDIDDRFALEDAENTTSVQLIHRGDTEDRNVLEREVLIDALEFQQTIQNNASINATLADDDPITGVENIVAMTAISQQDAAELEERGENLADRGEALEARGEELANRGEALEERGAELGEREAELEASSEVLETGIDEAREIQREYEQLASTTDEDDPEYQQGAAELEAEFEAMLEETADAAALDDEQAAEYEELAQQARGIESGLFEIEQTTDDPDAVSAYQDLNEDLEGIYTAATMGVLEAEYEQLEDDFEAFEAEQDALEADQAAFEDEQESLEADQEALEADQEALQEDDDDPSLEEQIETLETIDDEAFEDAIDATLGGDEADDANGSDDAPGLAFMPTDYEPGSTDADARMTAITQEVGDADLEMGGADDDVLETQLEIRELAADHDHEYVVFGIGIITDEIDRSMGDSLAIVGPLALAFVVAALSIAYRDPLDIALGVVGIVAVLVWTFGFMGWAGIAFNQMMVAVPVLLIGLSIDYAIHVFMRHREQRELLRHPDRTTESPPGEHDGPGETDTVRGSMSIALAGVGVALVWVTATTAIGFLANLVSPIGPIREFAVVSAVGILSALIVFGALVPAAKVEIDSLLEHVGFDRHKRAFGTGEGRFSDVLSIGSVAARRIPLILLVAVLLLTAGGVYGASQVDTSFEEEDFLAESPPAWTENLGPLAPGEYQAADDLEYVNENFQRDDLQTQILIEGNVTGDGVLERIDTAQTEAADSSVVYTLPDGEADVEGPLSVMEETAAQNESFNESFTAADTTGDDVPDENVTELYDELFAVNEDGASQVIDRSDGEYDGVRLVVSIEGDAPVDETTAEMRAIANTLDDEGAGDERLPADVDDVDDTRPDDGEVDDEDAAAVAGQTDGLTAIATGDPIVNHIVEQDLFDTVIQSLLVTLVAVFVFLTAAYWLTGNSATLGAVTLLPVAFAVSWILGTMYLAGIPFNVLTGMITSLTIGLGVAYSIHVSARYTLELDRQGNVWDAMQTTVTGTGGALLGSAATTVGGFGTLALAIFPALRQFGIITGLTITYAFLASVVVLPTLLVLWTRYFGPDVSFDSTQAKRPAATASDGGRPEADPGDASAEKADVPDADGSAETGSGPADGTGPGGDES
ncbi:Patched family protein [Salinadaptatus halalkaliphilus]|uniref:Patched family protein n=1 Tax=Salinadaptatus halalkaliphilus TaxID=2419781 RepID=A0A4S3TLQ5_9EURY|nr:MMPL family transporter [Salinadaptatus halalkaliphilus]THE65099.1 Patched family protein [Salinadaptatus halalkaliphilus]